MVHGTFSSLSERSRRFKIDVRESFLRRFGVSKLDYKIIAPLLPSSHILDTRSPHSHLCCSIRTRQISIPTLAKYSKLLLITLTSLIALYSSFSHLGTLMSLLLAHLAHTDLLACDRNGLTFAKQTRLGLVYDGRELIQALCFIACRRTSFSLDES